MDNTKLLSKEFFNFINQFKKLYKQDFTIKWPGYSPTTSTISVFLDFKVKIQRLESLIEIYEIILSDCLTQKQLKAAKKLLSFYEEKTFYKKRNKDVSQ